MFYNFIFVIYKFYILSAKYSYCLKENYVENVAVSNSFQTQTTLKWKKEKNNPNRNIIKTIKY